jgi:hypothetical protein
MQDSSLENKPLYFYHGLDVKDFRRIENEEELQDINEKGYDIFWTLNQFTSGRRIKDNLEFFKWVVADFDDIPWEEFCERFRYLPKPTMAIRTRSGFHCYWKLKTPIKGSKRFCEEYKDFVGHSLCPLGADENAKDVCRVLRAPMYRYWQDSKNNRYEDKEIRCEVIYDDGPSWEWGQLRRLFKRPMGSVHQVERRLPTTEQRTFGEVKQTGSGNNFWAKCNAIPVEEGIRRLSGHNAVRGQQLTTRSEGKIKRLLVNGNPSNGWIDEKGRFGSTYENTAGTLVNFLKFPEYGLSNSDIAKIFKEVFHVTDT